MSKKSLPSSANLLKKVSEPKKDVDNPASSKVMEEILTLARQQASSQAQIVQEAFRAVLIEAGGMRQSAIDDRELRSLIYLASRRWAELEPLIHFQDLPLDVQERLEKLVARLRESFADLERLTRTSKAEHILGAAYRDANRRSHRAATADDDGPWATDLNPQ